MSTEPNVAAICFYLNFSFSFILLNSHFNYFESLLLLFVYYGKNGAPANRKRGRRKRRPIGVFCLIRKKNEEIDFCIECENLVPARLKQFNP